MLCYCLSGNINRPRIMTRILHCPDPEIKVFERIFYYVDCWIYRLAWNGRFRFAQSHAAGK
jgi:hypothetical protein